MLNFSLKEKEIEKIINSIYKLESSLIESSYNLEQIQQFFNFDYYDIFILCLDQTNSKTTIIKINKTMQVLLLYNECNTNFILNHFLIIGYALFQKINLENLLELHKIVIHPSFRKQGFGYAFLRDIITHYKNQNVYNKIILEVSENNYFAIKLYQKLHFYIYHKRKNYYHNNETALLMMREI
ncbi:MAG: hypothetical protein KatS3mg129_1475 [Leptospiraceae bacterium]|nr:MAG: hypothetical protein KatS3mg129_1475 [Leptospiraceae bacterium]